MPLVSTVIEQGFKAMIVTKPANGSAAATQLSNIYQAYAASAVAGVAPPVFTGTEKVRFAAALQAVLSTPDHTAAEAAGAFVAAVTTFWLTPPVLFGAGAVTAFAGAPALLAALTAFFGAFNDTDAAAAGLATLLDVATKTITVVIGPTTFTLT